MKMMDTSQYTVAECYNKGAAKTDAKWTTVISALSAPPGDRSLLLRSAPMGVNPTKHFREIILLVLDNDPPGG